MKKKLLILGAAALLLVLANKGFGQAPTLGKAAEFALFSTNGAVSNTGISQVTGNVGTNNGSSTAFGNVNGGMHDMDGLSGQAATDLLTAYNLLNGTAATMFPAPLLGNGQTLTPGVYSITSAATLNLSLTLDGQNNPNSVFIIRIHGSLSTNAAAKVHLINQALACNVFWQVEGLINMASGTTMRGNLIANNGAISLNTGDTLEGRALSTAGAVSIGNSLVYTPIGCGSPTLNGPVAPAMGAAACYAIFSGSGAVTNTGITHVVGDVGTNVGSTTGYNSLLVTGTVHASPDGSTAQCAADLLTAYNYLNTLTPDIELLYPAQFGSNLVLTPHTYYMGGAATLTDTVILNAENNANAVFVIQINGALTTSTYANVKLINGTQAKNVYWKVEGAVTINNYSVFNGILISHNGALGAINTGVVLNGQALTTSGALTTDAITITDQVVPGNCASVGIQERTETTVASIFPNPFSGSATLVLSENMPAEGMLWNMYNVLGERVMSTMLFNQTTTVSTGALPSGIYFYELILKGKTMQTGKLISEQ
ncbi:MAG TPA: ice-binding family protein [Bacteroidia bacterium]|jgi:hypothetical protein|nr:ice-binding family protein [Bacteroidia bacterium]